MLGIDPAGPASTMGANFLLGKLDAASHGRLELAGSSGVESGAGVWWVGGGVRDLLLGRGAKALDLDVVIEGDLDRYVERLTAGAGAVRVTRSAFLTAEVELPDGARIDIVRARRERYASPGALPEVEPADLESDLRRRDFTVNSLAIELAPRFGAALVDPAEGRADIAANRLRVHHQRSFLDDPTRIFRAIDFESRFGFRLDEASQALARAAVDGGAVDVLSGARLRNAAIRCFGRRATAEPAWLRAEELGALRALDSALSWTGSRGAAVGRALRQFAGTVADTGEPSLEILLLGLGALLAATGRPERARLARRLALDAASSTLLLDGLDGVAAAAAELGERSARSEAHRRLGRMSAVELALAAAAGPALERWVRCEIDEMRRLRLEIDGRALLDRGVEAGPALGEALAFTLDARLDGRIAAGEELEFALARARSGGPR